MQRRSRALLVSVAVAFVVSALPTAVSVGSVRSAVSAGSANVRAARADARSLLGLLRLPGGATRSAGEPVGDSGALARTGGLYDLPTEVDVRAFWTVAASPQSVLAFVKASPPDGFKLFVTGSGNSSAVTYYDEAFQSSPITNVVAIRELWVEAAVLADGRTGVRADAEELAITPRGTLERIPARSARLLVTTDAAAGGGEQTVLASVTSQAKIRRAVTLLDGLPLVPVPIGFGCPANQPQRVALAFYSPDDTRLALASFVPWPVTTNVHQCNTVSLTINGRLEQPSLLAQWYPGCGLSRFPALLTRLETALKIKFPDNVPPG
jgi:hypothetical protein